MNTDVGRSIDTGPIAELLNSRASGDRSALVADLVQEVLRCMARLEADQADLSRAVEALRAALAEEDTHRADPLTRLRAEPAPVEEEPWTKVLSRPVPDNDEQSRWAGTQAGVPAPSAMPTRAEAPALVPQGTLVLTADAADAVLVAEFGAGPGGPSVGAVAPPTPVFQAAPVVPPAAVAAPPGLAVASPAAMLAPLAPPESVDALLAAEFGSPTPAPITGAVGSPLAAAPRPESSIDDLLSSALSGPAASAPPETYPTGVYAPPTPFGADQRSDESIDSVLASFTPSSVDSDALGEPDLQEDSDPTAAVRSISSEEDDNLASFLGREFLAQNSLEGEQDTAIPDADASAEHDGEPSAALWRSFAPGSETSALPEESGNPFFSSEMPTDDFFARTPRLRRRHRR